MSDADLFLLFGLPLWVAMVTWQLATGEARGPTWSVAFRRLHSPRGYWAYMTLQLAVVLLGWIAAAVYLSRH